MISVEEARKRIGEALHVLPVKEVPLQEAFAHFTAAPIPAPHDHPLFDNSAVDGYALRFAAYRNEFRVIGEIAAGGNWRAPIGEGECVRIFTGAKMPADADTVVMQEHVQRNGDRIVITDLRTKRGANVRRKGEQIHAGDQVISAGEELTPAAIGLLASVGVKKVRVHEWPYVSVIITGDEFVSDELEDGRIFSSNDLMLSSALQRIGIKAQMIHAKDDEADLERAVRQALSRSDVIITTGGVSVGDHDLVAPILDRTGAEILFHKVAQKPGKPMLFARNGNTVIIGLPGNPRAVMILFWEYVLPALRKMMGSSAPGLRSEQLPLTHDLQMKGERAEFRAARIVERQITLLPDEGSHMLSTLLKADALAFFPGTTREVKKGDLVEVHYLPA